MQVARHDDGFQLRGLETTRLETFTDAAFAFSVTMLVLDQGIPQDASHLLELMKGVPAFLASLANLMMFWAIHRRFSRRYGLEDATTILFTIALIAVMLIYVFPLKFMFTQAFAWMIPPLRTAAFRANPGIAGPVDLSNVFVVYGVGFVIFQSIFLLLFRHALRLRAPLGLNAVEVYDTRTDIGLALIQIAVGLVSILIAVVFRSAGYWVVLAGWAYATLSVILPVYAIRRDRGRRVLLAASAG